MVVESADKAKEMTDLEYDTLTILLEVKVLTKKELHSISTALASPCEAGWGWLIDWLNAKPNVEPKRRRRLTAADYHG
jgi:hypothetical protein